MRANVINEMAAVTNAEFSSHGGGEGHLYDCRTKVVDSDIGVLDNGLIVENYRNASTESLEYLREVVSKHLSLGVSELDPNLPFGYLGVNEAECEKLKKLLEDELGVVVGNEFALSDMTLVDLLQQIA